jgi:hypothetical protein
MTPMSVAFINAVESGWRGRCLEQGVKPEQRRYYTLQMEFFLGAVTAYAAMTGQEANAGLIPPRWFIYLTSCRPITSMTPLKEEA